MPKGWHHFSDPRLRLWRIVCPAHNQAHPGLAAVNEQLDRRPRRSGRLDQFLKRKHLRFNGSCDRLGRKNPVEFAPVQTERSNTERANLGHV